MFYLKILSRFIRNYPFKNLLFLALSIMLVAAPFYRSFLEENVRAWLPNSAQGDSFHALVSSDINIARVGRKLRALPGVYQVISLGEKEVTTQVKQLMDRLDVSSSLLDGINLNSAGINVIFKKGLNKRVKKLIRDYLVKFVGPQKVTLGAIVERDQSLTWLDRIRMSFDHWGFLSCFVLLVGLWIMAYIPWAKEMVREIKVIQAYQRRQYIVLKVYFSILLLCISVSVGLLVLNNFHVEVTYLLASIGLLLIGSLLGIPQVMRSVRL